MDRRSFLYTSALVTAMPLTLPVLGAATPKKALVLGGTDFLGPTIIDELMAAGYVVTMLNRGQTNPGLFAQLEHIRCDRELEDRAGLVQSRDEIAAYNWDLVVDTWQKSPKAVEDFLGEFADYFHHYHYVSSMSVYSDWNVKGIDEQYPLNETPPFPTTISQSYRYAIRKTLAEQVIAEMIPGKYSISRCHGIRSDRIPNPGNPHEEPYWPIRFHMGGKILVPDVQDHYFQITNAYSLAKFIIGCFETTQLGAFNVACEPIPFRHYVQTLTKVTGHPDELHWIPGEFLKAQGLLPYENIEYWRDGTPGAYQFDTRKARSAGLVDGSLEDLIKRQIHGFLRRHPSGRFEFGEVYDGSVVKIPPEKEREVIRKWLNRAGG